MKTAMLADGTPVDAITFEDQSEDWRDGQRGLLTCLECGADAWFRRRTRDGRAATFGAHHADGCPAATDVRTVDGTLSREEPTVRNSGRVTCIVMDGAAPSRDAGERVRDDGDTHSGHHGTTHTAGPPRETHTRNQSLRAVLRTLIRQPSHLQSAGQTVLLPELGEVLGSSVIRRFTKNDTTLTAADQGQMRLVWGAVETIKRPRDVVYVNAANPPHNPATIKLSAGVADALANDPDWKRAQERAQFNSADVYAIGFGTVTTAGSSDFTVSVYFLNRFTFIVGPDH